MIKNKAVINTGNRIELEGIMFMQEAELSLSACKNVLGVSAVSRILNYEALNGELRISGRLTAKILYENMEDGVESQDYSREFAETVQMDITANDKAFLKTSIVEIEYSGGAELKIVFSVSISGYIVKENEMEYLECQGELFTKKDTVRTEKLCPLTDSNIDISKSFECKFPIMKILSYNTVCYISNVFCYDELYQVEGEAITTVIALGEEKRMMSECFAQNFTVEVPDAKINSASEIILEAAAKSTTIILEEEGGRSLIVDLEIALKGICIVKTDIEVLADAYSVDKELAITSKTVSCDTDMWQRRKAETLKASLHTEDEISCIEAVMPPVASVMCVSNNFGLFAEGVVTLNVIYRNKEGALKAISGGMPYQILVGNDFPADKATVNLIIKGCNARIKTNNEIEIILDLIIDAKGCRRRSFAVIEDIEESGDKPDNDVAISLYIARDGESLWDVAKMLSTDEDTLLRLNPDIKMPLESGERLLLYRELTL